ncbi:MAG: hypothetical protein ACOYOO_07765 [Saprospiraceae bacterium]|jgi:hypothetical protein
MANGNVPTRKKVAYPIGPALLQYLADYGRAIPLPVHYEDLLRHHTSVPLLDLEGQDTLWESVYYPEYEQREIYQALKYIYALLKTSGTLDVIEHLTIARIDHCTFGNSKPFRIRIINRLNDNYDHFYVKRADASRVYGLELENLLSPNQVLYFVHENTLIEEHIAGIPGDLFLKKYLQDSVFNQIRIAKEFVKFNERCFVRLLGDMRSYNYVAAITPDIEGNQYRLRAIDFDQQSYEGWRSFYLPQYFKENNPVIFLGVRHMAPETVRQYQLEEHSLMATRIQAEAAQVGHLFRVMIADDISKPDKIARLREELAIFHRHAAFESCRTMGEIVLMNIRFMLEKDFKRKVLV